LQALCSRSLLSYDRESDRYQQHDLIRLAAARDLETWPAQAVETARLRLALHYQGVARAAGARYEQGGEGVRQGLASFALDWPHIRAGQAWAASRAGGSGEAAWLCSDYADAAAALLSLRLHPRDWIAWLEAATRAARRLGDRRAEGNHLVRLGKAHRDLGKLEEAVDYFQQAVSVARQAGDRRSEGAWLANLGQVYHDQGLTAPARDSWTQALALLEAVEDPRAESVRRSLSELED
jgi:tetratricopeptide (TPR) repeat protein